MRAGDELLGAVFNKDHRYVIPIFQRPYVWDEEMNWTPLWEDLRKAAEQVEKQSQTEDDDVQEFFLGALVTQHRAPIPRRIQTSMIIDGQQRMTTFQVFLAAARRVAVEYGALHAADSFAALVRNRVSADSDHPEDRFKVTPLEHDRPIFEWAVRDPDNVTRSAHPNHKISRASDWFEQTVRDWVSESDSPANRLDLLHFAVENRIKVVSIFLDANDDPQVIFEALNHRGVRLDAADLVKNLLFQTLDRQGDHQHQRDLLDNHWAMLDSGHWRDEITTGRVKRVRVDVLLAYWLSAQRGEESSVEHLFEDFKRWLRNSQARAADVIRDLRVYADTMDRLQRLPMTSPIAQILDRLDATNTTTPWPLLLYLNATAGIPEEQALIGALALDSYLMRRAICRMGTKDYNRLFGALLGAIKSGSATHAGDLLVKGLAAQTAENRLWPDDAQFVSALLNENLYRDVVRARLRTLLIGLENQLLSTKAEPTVPYRAASRMLSIEHVMPQKWEQHWPLSNASDEHHDRRQAHVHALGNLTLTTRNLNSTLQNQAWGNKRRTLQTHSLARLTTGSILAVPESVTGFTQDQWTSEWNEERISLRGHALVSVALATWPRPEELPDGAEIASFSGREATRGTQAAKFRRSPSTPIVRSVHEVKGSIRPLIEAGLVSPGDQLSHEQIRSGLTFTATVTAGGRIETSAGIEKAPSSALRALLGYDVNGWTNWIHVPSGRTLAELRKKCDV